MSGNILDREQYRLSNTQTDDPVTTYLTIDETGIINQTHMSSITCTERTYKPLASYKLLQFLKKHELLLFIHAYLDTEKKEPDPEAKTFCTTVIRRTISNALDRYPPTLDDNVQARTDLVERIISNTQVQSYIVGGSISVRQVATLVAEALNDQVYPAWLTPPKTERELSQEIEALAGTTWRIQYEDGLVDIISVDPRPGNSTTFSSDREGLQAAIRWLKERVEENVK